LAKTIDDVFEMTPEFVNKTRLKTPSIQQKLEHSAQYVKQLQETHARLEQELTIKLQAANARLEKKLASY